MDLIIIKGPPPGKLWPEDFVPDTIGTAEAVRQMISNVLPQVQWLGPMQGSLETGEADILFVLHENKKDIDSIDIEAGSRGDPEPVLRLLCERNGWRIFDMASAEFIDPMPVRKWWQIWK